VFVIELEPPVIETPTAGFPDVVLDAEMLPLLTTRLLLPLTLRPEVPPEILPVRVTVIVRLLPEKLLGPVLGPLMVLSASAVAGTASPKAAISRYFVMSLFMAYSSFPIDVIGDPPRPVKQSQRDKHASLTGLGSSGIGKIHTGGDVFWEAGARWDV
jgi:hypothetical protein